MNRNWVTEHYAFYDSFVPAMSSSDFVTRKVETVTTSTPTALDYVTHSLPAMTASDAADIAKFVTEMSSYDHFVS